MIPAYFPKFGSFAGQMRRFAPSADFELGGQGKGMLSVLQVTPALEAGGVERTTIEIAEAIARAGGRALVASRGGRLEGELAAAGGELTPMPLDTKNPLTMIVNARRIAALAKRQGVRLIHARSRAPGWSALWAARSLNLPFVTTYHGVYNARSAPKRLYNSVMARGDLVIANSHFTRAHVIATHAIAPARVIAIPRGVDLARFDPAVVGLDRIQAMRRLWGLAEDETRAIFLLPGRVTRWKGQTTFIDAASQIEAQNPGRALYVIAGDAQGREAYVRELQDLCAARGVGDCVKLVGHLTDMPAALAACTAAVFPSLDPEAFGRAAVEAQAMGVPVIVAAHGGLIETVQDGVTGVHVAPGDVAALAGAMRHMLAMPEAGRKAFGAAGIAHVRATYSTSALQAATIDVYRRLLEAQR
jgi:glycosyltransferase involved in cell wall biosynthesis